MAASVDQELAQFVGESVTVVVEFGLTEDGAGSVVAHGRFAFVGTPEAHRGWQLDGGTVVSLPADARITDRWDAGLRLSFAGGGITVGLDPPPS